MTSRTSRRSSLRTRVARLAVAGLLLGATPALGRPAAGPAAREAGRPLAVALADFDEDGLLDAACGYAGGSLSVRAGNAPGSARAFSEAEAAVALPDAPDFVVAGDFDADGHADVAIASAGGRTIFVLPGDGRGGLGTPTPVEVGARVASLELAEVGRADGLPDFVVSAEGGRTIAFASPEGAARAEGKDLDAATPVRREARGPALRWDADATPDPVTFSGDEPVVAVAAKTSATFTVTNKNDAGAGSLRQAILDANATAGADTITFAITDPAPYVIDLAPGSPLPAVTETATIDATTQTGATPGTPVVAISGTLVGGSDAGLTIGPAATGSVVRGLAVIGFAGDGVVVQASNCVLEGNVIGLPVANGGSGVVVAATSNTTIGGTTAATRNVISNNGQYGVLLSGAPASNNKIQGNYIGTNVGGTAAAPNGFDGVLVGSGSNNTIGGTTAGSGNVISGNGATGVYLDSPGGAANLVQGNVIGLAAGGSVPVPNEADGVIADGVPNNTIGGTTPAARNVISGNGGPGVTLVSPESSGNVVAGNYIGTDVTGAVARGNGVEGVSISDAPNNTIGGTAAGSGNVISANAEEGVEIFGPTATGNLVAGNLIGTNAAGTGALGNHLAGVLIDSASGNTVGGTTAGARNVISANLGAGVEVSDENTNGNTIAGNYIGTAADGTTALGNALDGVRLGNSSTNTTVGGLVAGAGNRITASGGAGVYVASGMGNQIVGNSIDANAGLGIDLDPIGSTPNDAGDVDNGANLGQNSPVVTSAAGSSVQGTLDSAPNTTYRIEVFSNASCDPSGRGEGKTFVGSGTATTNASGAATFSVTLPSPLAAGQIVTTTATGTAAGTSEFSACVAVAAPGNADVSLSVADAPEPVASGADLTYTFTVHNAGPDAAESVVVTTATPAGTTFKSASVSQGTASTPVGGGTGAVSFAIGTLASGATATATLVVTVTAANGTTLSLDATATSATGDPSAANNTAHVDTTVSDAPPVDPPVIAGVSKLGDPFRIKITGSNFQPGAQVFVGDDATPWPSVKQKDTTSLTLKKGGTLKQRFPKGVAVMIRVVNPDGGEATTTYTR